jgi:hypothetical protein
MTRMQTVGYAALGLVLAVGVGYFWGAWGRWQLSADLADCQRQEAIGEARSHLLQARVDLFSNNFGAAARELEASGPALEAAAAEFERAGRREPATLLRQAIPIAEDAQRRAAAVDETANARTAEVLAALDQAIAVPSP